MFNDNRKQVEVPPKSAMLAAEGGALDRTSMTIDPNVKSTEFGAQTSGRQAVKFVQRIPGAVVDFFRMGQALANAESRTWKPDQPGYSEFRLARSILESVHDLDDLPKHALSAVALLLQAGHFAARAIVLRRGLMPSGEDPLNVWQKATSEPDIQSITASLPAGLRARTDALVRTGISVENTSLGARELAGLRSTLTPVVDKMVEVLEREATLKFRIQSERFFRWFAIGVVLLGVCVWRYRFEIRSMMLPNLALHKEVKISSNWRVGMYPASKLVDGEPTELGCHTDAEDRPWAQVDLGRKVGIHRVVVTNRLGGDTVRAVPLEIELSVDGVNFTHYARQEDDFNVWIASTGRVTKARYVRVTVQKRSMLHLNEIEVY